MRGTLSNATNKAGVDASSGKRKVADRRGVSEIRRSEAVLSERNAELEKQISELKKNLATKAASQASAETRASQLEEEVARLNKSMQQLETQRVDDVAAAKATLTAEHNVEIAKSQRKVAVLCRTLENHGFDAVAVEKAAAKEEQEIGTAVSKIDETIAAIDLSCGQHRERCAEILGQLNRMTSTTDSIEVPVVASSTEAPDFSTWSSAEWGDATSH